MAPIKQNPAIFVGFNYELFVDRTADNGQQLPLEEDANCPDLTSAAQFSEDKNVSKKGGFCGDFSRFLVCRGRENSSQDEMAVDAVFREPLSRSNSHKQGKIQ
jgi:hypothetical protein